ncbi:hypothetical protein AALA52_03830 [Lactococcus ileimucosae]|uniref:LXG domain-containing protein n=1 Tax=Lactococcus ileimucosae TaxID=2941329 RepID=A0ABV4D4N9_9LACT
MGKIESSVEAAQEAVQPLLNLEKPKFEKITLVESNIQGMKNALELMEEVEQTVTSIVDFAKNQAGKFVTLAQKKEQDDKHDRSLFSSELGGSGGGRSLDYETLKDRLSKKTDWQKYGREHLEEAGVFFKKDGSGYVIDGAKAVENIVGGVAECTFKYIEDGIERGRFGHSPKNNSRESSPYPTAPDFNPNP